MRWTDKDVADYERRMGTLGTRDISAPSRGKTTAGAPGRARGNPSKLELELSGHFAAMQLAAEQQYKFHPERRWRFDFAFPSERVAVEIDGGIFAAENGTEAGRHARGAGRIKDYEKRNAAAELGWLVLCYGPPQVRSGEAALQAERLVRARRLLLLGSAV